MARAGRDNIAGTQGGIGKRIFLAPGKVIQWVNYMSVGSVKGYAKVRAQTRMSRSPFFTWLYSIAFWVGSVFVIYVLSDDYFGWKAEKQGVVLAAPAEAVIEIKRELDETIDLRLPDGDF